jgi:hypothetical protein
MNWSRHILTETISKAKTGCKYDLQHHDEIQRRGRGKEFEMGSRPFGDSYGIGGVTTNNRSIVQFQGFVQWHGDYCSQITRRNLEGTETFATLPEQPEEFAIDQT